MVAGLPVSWFAEASKRTFEAVSDAKKRIFQTIAERCGSG
jgi:hypothetical protein